ncbi:MAG: hypothetical protein ABSH49_14775 [Bryobacteraceae bacterium]|jgi:hypothetical protein
MGILTKAMMRLRGEIVSLRHAGMDLQGGPVFDYSLREDERLDAIACVSWDSVREREE